MFLFNAKKEALKNSLFILSYRKISGNNNNKTVWLEIRGDSVNRSFLVSQQTIILLKEVALGLEYAIVN